MEPSVAFLKPIGMDMPDASSRCTWLSVLRAPIAPQLIRSQIYCGVIRSSHSVAAGKPAPQHVGKHLASHEHALANIELAVKIRIGRSRPFQPIVVRGFSKYTRMTMTRRSSSSFLTAASLSTSVRSLRIMNRTRADDGQQTIVTAMQHVTNLLTGLQHQIAHLVRERKFLKKISGSGNRVKLTNIDIHDLSGNTARSSNNCASFELSGPRRPAIASVPPLHHYACVAR